MQELVNEVSKAIAKAIETNQAPVLLNGFKVEIFNAAEIRWNVIKYVYGTREEAVSDVINFYIWKANKLQRDLNWNENVAEVPVVVKSFNNTIKEFKKESKNLTDTFVEKSAFAKLWRALSA